MLICITFWSPIIYMLLPWYWVFLTPLPIWRKKSTWINLTDWPWAQRTARGQASVLEDGTGAGSQHPTGRWGAPIGNWSRTAAGEGCWEESCEPRGQMMGQEYCWPGDQTDLGSNLGTPQCSKGDLDKSRTICVTKEITMVIYSNPQGKTNIHESILI